MPPDSLVGIDGCRGGWLAVAEREGGLRVELWANLEPLFTQAWDAACVDIPIGLKTGKERRACDIEARRLLGKRRSSVFFAPSRDWLQAVDYEEVRGFGVSLQTFHILPKVREMDHRITADDQRFLHESHPEMAYARRAGEVLESKKTAPGRAIRQEILQSVGSKFSLSQWSDRFKRSQVGLDDLLDAAILLEVARDLSRDSGKQTGGVERDSRGLKMEICF